MLFEWDEGKRARNLDRHKLDLIDGKVLFDGWPVVTSRPKRQTSAFGQRVVRTKIAKAGLLP
ncbi:hypothetical protein GCM10009416_10000 [Craurococcus roseus]|uniref:BrnT family toxin n=1 Tax=Craurococcus roseus TaxID=77585 RepID=A0ABP3PR92_9PROT